MSSVEIAILCEKQHGHVLRDIRLTLDELGISHAPFLDGEKNSRGREYDVFNLPRRECDILIAGYSIKYRAAIVDRWHELGGCKTFAHPMRESKGVRRLPNLKDGLDPHCKISAITQWWLTRRQGVCLS